MFYNGSKLASNEFTATNGTTFVLATACQANDIVQAVVAVTGGGIGGSGTTNYISKWTASGVLGNSTIQDNGTTITLGSALSGTTGTFSGQVEGTIINSTSNAFRLNGNNALSLVTLNSQSVVKINAAGFWGTQLVGANDKGILINNTGEVQITSRNLSVTNNVSNEIGVWVKGVGTHSSGYASIQSFASDVTYETKLVLQENGGSVLIGTTSIPSAYGKLTIRGTNQGLTIQDAATNGYRAIYSQSGNLYFYNGTNEGYLSSGGTWVNASDITLKKDVKEIEYGLKEVMELKPKWYRMIEDDLEQIGFIAQDVEEVLPELVSTSEKGMKGLSYGQLTAVLVKAIQEQQKQIEELKQLVK